MYMYTCKLLMMVLQYMIYVGIYDIGLLCLHGLLMTFDKVPHRRILHKIQSLGFPGQMLNLIKSFLTDKQQLV